VVANWAIVICPVPSTSFSKNQSGRPFGKRSRAVRKRIGLFTAGLVSVVDGGAGEGLDGAGTVDGPVVGRPEGGAVEPDTGGLNPKGAGVNVAGGELGVGEIIALVGAEVDIPPEEGDGGPNPMPAGEVRPLDEEPPADEPPGVGAPPLPWER
jgi:hypothetical protein